MNGITNLILISYLSFFITVADAEVISLICDGENISYLDGSNETHSRQITILLTLDFENNEVIKLSEVSKPYSVEENLTKYVEWLQVEENEIIISSAKIFTFGGETRFNIMTSINRQSGSYYSTAKKVKDKGKKVYKNDFSQITKANCEKNSNPKF